MDFGYPEINQLNALYVKYKVWTKTDRSQLLEGKPYYPLVNIEFGGQSFALFIDDEFDDLRKNYPTLNLCLFLRELEGYAFTPDVVRWSEERFLDHANPQVQGHFKSLGAAYEVIKEMLGEVSSYVSDFDFEMNAGPAQALRRDP